MSRQLVPGHNAAVRLVHAANPTTALPREVPMRNARSSRTGPLTPRFLLAFPLVVLLAAGCGDSVTGPSVPTALQLEPGQLELKVGASAEITVLMTDQYGRSLPIPDGFGIHWSTSSEDVANVVDGLVTAKAPGQTLIVAKADDLPAVEVMVTVVGGSDIAGSRFETIVLGSLNASQSNGWVINDAGVAAGWSSVSGGRAILWPISGPPADFLGEDSGTRGINNPGAIVGWVRHPDGAQRGYVFADGERIDLTSLGLGPAVATGINATGTVVGRSNARVVVWQPDTGGGYGGPVDVGPYAIGTPDINDHGTIVFTAELPTDGGWIMYRPLLGRADPDGNYDEPIRLGAPGTTDYAAHAINNAGLVVGVRYGMNATYAVLWHPDDYARPIDLGVGEAWDINDHNQVVGTLGGPFPVFGDEARRPGLWIVAADGSVLEEIALGSPAGFASGGARGINNEGWIIGSSWGPGPVQATLWRPLE
jgi:probable HAF family extracellular repeat protein